jgi:hypothetical protein
VHEKECQLSVYSVTVFEKLFYLFPQSRLELFGLIFREQFRQRVSEFGAKVLAKVVSISPWERRRILIFIIPILTYFFFLNMFLWLLNFTLQLIIFLKISF